MTTPTILPSTVLKLLIALFVPVATVAATVSVRLWRGYREHKRALTVTPAVEYKQSEFEGELAEVLHPFLADLETNADGGLTKRDVEQALDAGVLTDEDIMSIVRAWENIGEVELLKTAYTNAATASYRSFALLSVGCLTLPLMTFVTVYSGTSPFTWAWDLAHATVGLFNAALLFRGIVKFKRANRLHERLERLNEKNE